MRVVVADDQAVVRAGFAALLDAQDGIEVVGTAGDGAELVDLVARTRPDLALVDVRMPVLDGIEATRRIAAAHDTRVLVLTTFDLDDYVYAALLAGASGFLLKDVTAERLVEAVWLVAEGAMLLGPSVTRRLVADFAGRGRAEAVGTGGGDAARARSGAEHDQVVAASGLTPREREVLLLVARGLSNAEIAADLVVAVETVKSHVSEVLRKTGSRDRVQLVVLAHEHGLVRLDPDG